MTGRNTATRGAATLLAITLLPPLAAIAQDQPVFDAEPVETCLADMAEMVDPSEKEQCIGLAADACMQSEESGYTTVGIGYCLSEELGFWDGLLNETYGRLMARSKDGDAEMKELEIEVPSQVEALRAMQRAWIAYRDAACAFELSQWGGGTGGGPAALGCHMSLTAKQALALETWLVDE